MMTQTRVVLADDDVLLREGIASLLEHSSFDVVGQAGAAAGLIDLVRERSPDLVVVDIRMPPGHSTEGLEAARVIRAEFPQIAILVCRRMSRLSMRWSCWPAGTASDTSSRAGSPTS